MNKLAISSLTTDRPLRVSGPRTRQLGNREVGYRSENNYTTTGIAHRLLARMGVSLNANHATAPHPS